MKRITVLTLCCLMNLLGCDQNQDESLPVPVPLLQYLKKSTPCEKNETLVVGLPKAVAGLGKVHVHDRQSSLETIVPSSEAGSFSGVLAVGKTAELEVAFETEQGISKPVLLSTKAIEGKLVLNPTDTKGQVVSSPDNQGLVTVTNDNGPSQPLLLYATPESDVIVANANNAAVASSKTDKDGRFQVKFSGSSGDKIQIMLVDTQETIFSSDFLSYFVP